MVQSGRSRGKKGSQTLAMTVHFGLELINISPSQSILFQLWIYSIILQNWQQDLWNVSTYQKRNFPLFTFIRHQHAKKHSQREPSQNIFFQVHFHSLGAFIWDGGKATWTRWTKDVRSEGMEGREITEVIQGALNRADLTNLTVDFIGLAFEQLHSQIKLIYRL